MADNIGNYVTRGQLIIELANAGKASRNNIALSSGTPTTAPAKKFTFAPATPTPAIGDWVVQGVFSAQIISLPTVTEIEIDDGTDFVDGIAILVQGLTFTGAEIDAFILSAMAFIDRHTRQWFNARTFTAKFVGNNTHLWQAPVAIISVAEVRLNGETPAIPVADYIVFNGRIMPDDRRNPKIHLINRDPGVFRMTSRSFRDDRQTEVDGVWGFLEDDGTTPEMIQRATLKLAVLRCLNTPGGSASSSASSSGKGPIKREETDLHEVEYYDPRSGGSSSDKHDGTGLSGDDEIDDIIAAFKSPIIIGGALS